MQPSKKEPIGSDDLFRARLDQIINMKHELVRLTTSIREALEFVGTPSRMYCADCERAALAVFTIRPRNSCG